MSKTAFTPGPWELVSLSGYGSPFSVRMPYIAATAKPDQTHYGIQSIRRREDANLVAAAPELYEALEAAANSSGFQYMFSETRDKINAALAKARGSTRPTGGSNHGQ